MKKRLVVLILAGIFMLNDVMTFVPNYAGSVNASGNYNSTYTQLNYETTFVEEYNDGNVKWSYRLNKASKSGLVDNITDLKCLSVVGKGSEIIVPSSIKGVTVIELGTEAFADNKQITEVTVPSTVIRICDKAFSGCENLTDVVFEKPDSLKVLGEKAFFGCKSLTSVILGSNLMKDDTTGNYVFSGCENLECVTLNNVTDLSIQEGSFDGCTKLSSVNSLTVSPAKTFNVGKYAFRNTAVKSMSFDIDVTIDEEAFYGCKKLENVIFHKKVALGVNAFAEAFAEETDVAKKIISIKGDSCELGEGALSNCKGLTDIEFTDTNATISVAKDCFSGTPLLKKLDFKGKTINIGPSAFNGSSVSTLRFERTVSDIDINIDGKVVLSDIYFYNPWVKGEVADGGTQSYNAYGYWNADNKDALFPKASNLRKYKDIQNGIKVEYIGASSISVGEKISADSVKVANVLVDGTEETVGYTTDGTKYSGYVLDNDVFEEGGTGVVTVSYWNCSDTFSVDVVAGTPTQKPVVTVSVAPTQKPSATVSVAPTQKPSATVSVAPTQKPVVTVTPGIDSRLSIKCSNKKIKLCSKTSKTTYKIFISKNIKISPVAKGKKIYYQIVKKGKKMSNSKWKLAGKSVSLKTQGSYCVYFKYKYNGKDTIMKTSGFIVDKAAPVVDVHKKTHKLVVKDKGSGIKYIKVNGKKVKSGYILKEGCNSVEVVDRAGNKKKVTCNIS